MPRHADMLPKISKPFAQKSTQVLTTEFLETISTTQIIFDNFDQWLTSYNKNLDTELHRYGENNQTYIDFDFIFQWKRDLFSY